MYKLMIVTHGTMAEAMKETLRMFTGDVDEVSAVGLNDTGIEDFRERLIEEIKRCYEPEKGLLVLVDLYGGTPFNLSMLEIKNKFENVEIITGVNLPLLIEASLLKTSNLRDIIDSIQESAKTAITTPTILTPSGGDE
ncbi:PTS sugar transporter subunit IIA [Clostridium frigidicarnis]|uniref:PTS system, mannose-specific IIA component n=1 Tax=Clostridium frigidicarnis TaxID=84698 RepID=A0A1I0YC93_9CLOT|nr:PTS sugar transporter subunit IIA [Clostridium frigidicarnis]SFB10891.1 PTS system, mannose-specific IIA component [Clostridium frigidicarnis]